MLFIGSIAFTLPFTSYIKKIELPYVNPVSILEQDRLCTKTAAIEFRPVGASDILKIIGVFLFCKNCVPAGKKRVFDMYPIFL